MSVVFKTLPILFVSALCWADGGHDHSPSQEDHLLDRFVLQGEHAAVEVVISYKNPDNEPYANPIHIEIKAKGSEDEQYSQVPRSFSQVNDEQTYCDYDPPLIEDREEFLSRVPASMQSEYAQKLESPGEYVILPVFQDTGDSSGCNRDVEGFEFFSLEEMM